MSSLALVSLIVLVAVILIGFFRKVSADDFVNAVRVTVDQAGMLSNALGFSSDK